MYCRFCGKELVNEAFACPSCGGLVHPLPKENIQPAQTERKEKVERLSHIFSKIGMILNIVAFGVCLLSLTCFFGFAYVKGWETVEEGIAWMLLWLYAWMASVSVGATACEFATAGFILGLIQKHNEKVKKRAICTFIASIIITLTAMFGFFFIFFTLENLPITL